MADGTRYGQRIPHADDHWRQVKGGYENCCAGDCPDAQLIGSKQQTALEQRQEVLRRAMEVVGLDAELLKRLAQ